MPQLNYPGRLITRGEQNKKIVKDIQKRLNEMGCGILETDGHFGPKTFNAVKLFQSRFSDQNGNALIIDGKIGTVTWAALFGIASVKSNNITGVQLLISALDIAKGEIGVTENPPGSNSGPRVNEYLASVGLNPGFAWCAAFLYWCFNKASAEQGRANPLIKTAGVLHHWNQAQCKKIFSADAIENPSIIKPGQLFLMSFSGGLGHTGIIEKTEGGFIHTIEGNTNDGGSREGTGVFRRVRKVNSVNKGFLEYR